MYEGGADSSYGLNYFEEKLRAHFRKLKELRASAKVDYPLYALEHGLCESEIGTLKCRVREEIQVMKPSLLHKLPWIVYAAELGYQYSGDEYWQTFEERTLGWGEHGDRYLIRKWYREFAGQYCAAEPIGKWAEHFSIICWPITHAILPKDLQRQLARLLYDARCFLSKELLDNPLALGKRLASHSWQFSSRFQTFAEQHQLLGQISTALLLHKQADQCLIEPSTLDRIITDLAREQAAKTWLGEARNRARTVVLSGLTSTKERRERIAAHSKSDIISAASIRPMIRLQKSEDDVWSVILEMPDLSEIMAYIPECRAFLQNSRCKINGFKRWKARGWLICGHPIVKLENWPDTLTTLVTFNPEIPDDLGFLKDVFRLPNYNTWLFKVNADGLAREVLSGCVRPDNSYIIFTKNDHTLNLKILSYRKIEVLCEGIQALAVRIPNRITQEIENDLSTIGLSTSHMIKIEPVGIVPKVWDEDGFGCWLSTDTVMVSLSSSLPIATYSLKLTDENENVIAILNTVTSEKLTRNFVKFPNLRTGVYLLKVSANLESSGELKVLGQATIRIDDIIIEGRDRSNISTIVVLSNPASPDLEDLWFGKASLHILGPPGHEITPIMKLFDDAGECIASRKFPKLTLPVSPTDWKAYLEDFVPAYQVEPSLNRACQCQLIFDGASLGKYELFCQRHILPVRWSISGHGPNMKLRLIDHTGTGASVSFFPCSQPIRENSLSAGDFLKGPIKWGQEGLLLAESTEYHQKDSIIVVPSKGYLRPSDLRINSQIDKIKRNTSSIYSFLDVITMWSDARVRNTIGAIRRYNILRLLHRTLYGVVSGFDWTDVEEQVDHIEDIQECIRNLRSSLNTPFKTKVERFVSDMASAYKFLHSFSPQDRAEYMSHYLDTIWKFDYPIWLAEFIMRLASSPESIRSWVKGNDMLQYGMESVLRMPYLLKVARMFVIAIHKVLTVKSRRLSKVPIYAGWDWDY